MTPNAAQLQRINHFIRKVLNDFPVPAEVAAQIIREGAQPLSQETLEPDALLLTTLEYNTDDPHAPFTAVIIQSMTLTEAMICSAPVAAGGMINTTGFSTTAPYFKVVSELPRLMDNRIPAMFNEEFITAGWIPPMRYEAIYHKSHPQVYDRSTQSDIVPKAFRNFVRASHFDTAYDEALQAFWGKHLQNYKTLMRTAFIEAYLSQAVELTLTLDEAKLAARAAGMPADKDLSNLTLEDLQATYRPDKNLDMRVLRIHNAEATSILTITDKQSQVTLLYIPGNSSPFHGFRNPASMRKQLVGAAKNATLRKALIAYFDPDTADSGYIYSGVEEALVGMSLFPEPAPASGFFNRLLHNDYWDPEQYINNPTYPALGGDPFDYMARQVRTRIAKMAANTIASPLDIRKTETIDALDKACLLAIPIALAMGTALLAEFCFLTAGSIEMAIGADDAIKGKPQGTERIAFGALNASPVVVHGLGTAFTTLNKIRASLGKAVREADGHISVSAHPAATVTVESTGRTLTPAHHPSGLQIVKINGDSFMTYKTPNDWGFFELFVSDPAEPLRIQSTGLYAIQSADLKWRRAGLSGGAPFRNAWQKIYRLLGGEANETFYSAYEMPASMRDTLAGMLPDSSKFTEEYEPLGASLQSLRDARHLFFEKRNKLAQDAATFFDSRTFSLLRPALPSFALSESQPGIIEKLFDVSDGVVVGESHGDLSSKAFLIDNMHTLARKGVKRLYFEHLLTDVHLPLLKAFYRAKGTPMSDELKNYLKAIYPPLRETYYSFHNLIIKARDAGIKIQPIDCTASYMLKGMPDPNGTLRQQLMNFYAAEVIQWVQTTKRRPGKWIALVGNSHTNTFQGTPGLAELTGSIGLRVKDAAAGQRLGIETDLGARLSLGIGKGEAVVKADLILRVDPNTLHRTPSGQPGPSHSQVARTPQTQLTRPGQFLLSAAGEGVPARIHYRTRRGEIQSFTVDQQGQAFSIAARGWALDNQPFSSARALVEGLKAQPGFEEISG